MFWINRPHTYNLFNANGEYPSMKWNTSVHHHNIPGGHHNQSDVNHNHFPCRYQSSRFNCWTLPKNKVNRLNSRLLLRRNAYNTIKSNTNRFSIVFEYSFLSDPVKGQIPVLGLKVALCFRFLKFVLVGNEWRTLQCCCCLRYRFSGIFETVKVSSWGRGWGEMDGSVCFRVDCCRC